MSIEDPYFVVRDEVNAAVSSCEQKLKEWRQLMEVSNLMFFFAETNIKIIFLIIEFIENINKKNLLIIHCPLC